MIESVETGIVWRNPNPHLRAAHTWHPCVNRLSDGTLLATFDIGQAVVVQQDVVLGVEAAEGTDALIARCGSLRREGPGGVLVKLSNSQNREFVLWALNCVVEKDVK